VTAKALRQAIVKATGTSRVLIILPVTDMALIKMIRNLATVMVQTAGRVNALDISLADKIVLVDGAMTKLENRVAKAAKAADREIEEVKVTPAAQPAKPAKVTAVKAKPVAKKPAVKKPTAKKITKAAK